MDQNPNVQSQSVTPTPPPVDSVSYADQAPATGKAKNGKGTASLILAIVGIFIPVLGFVLAIIGFVLGILGLKAEKKGSAVAGLIISSIILLFGLVSAIIVVTQFSNEDSWFNTVVMETYERELKELNGEDEGYYVNSDFDFMIKSPTGWDVNESGDFGAVVFFYNPDTDMEDGKPFATNINVLVTDVTEYCDDIDECYDIMLESIESYSSDASVLDAEFVDVNGSDGYIITANYSQGGYVLRGTQLIVLNGGVLYTVTGTSLESTADNYTDIFEDSLMSFELNW